MNTVNILIKVMGSPIIGMGHIVRSLELAEEMQVRDEANVKFWCNEDTASSKKITEKGYECHWEKQASVEELLEFILKEQIDVFVIDHPGEHLELCRALKLAYPKNQVIVALDYFNFDNVYLDILINLFNQNPTQQSPKSSKVQYYEGVEYGIIRSSFLKYLTQTKFIAPQVRTVVVSFGGSDRKERTVKVIQALLGKKIKDVTFQFIIGVNFARKEVVKEMVEHLDVQTEILGDVSDMEKWIYRCDIGLIGGGTTIMEFAALGTPAIFIGHNVEEARFADFFAQRNAVMNLGVVDKVRNEDIWNSFMELSENREKRVQMSVAGKKLVDGRGKERIVDIIFECYKTQRKAAI